MKILIVALAVAAALLAFARADEATFTFTTIDGREFKNVTLSSKDKDGIRVVTGSGVEAIPFFRLPPSVQKQFGYIAPKVDDGVADAQAAQAAKMQRDQAAAEAALHPPPPPPEPIAFRTVLGPAYYAIRSFPDDKEALLIEQGEYVARLKTGLAKLPQSPERDAGIRICDAFQRTATLTGMERARIGKRNLNGKDQPKGSVAHPFFDQAVWDRWIMEIAPMENVARQAWDRISESAASDQLASFAPDIAAYRKARAAAAREMNIRIVEILAKGVLAEMPGGSFGFIEGYSGGALDQRAAIRAYREDIYQYKDGDGRPHAWERWILVPEQGAP